jgi:hypothetical protein
MGSRRSPSGGTRQCCCSLSNGLIRRASYFQLVRGRVSGRILLLILDICFSCMIQEMTGVSIYVCEVHFLDRMSETNISFFLSSILFL